jgi:hypothetical protein
MDLTLLELSLDDADITANAPFSSRGSTEAEAPDGPDDGAPIEGATTVEIDAEDRDDEAGGRSGAPIGAIVALVVILALVALVRRRHGGDEAIEVE